MGSNSSLHREKNETTECPVCLESYNEKENAKTKSICSHCFCLICFEKIRQVNPLCPLCRKKLDYFDQASRKDVKIINPYEEDKDEDEIPNNNINNSNINRNNNNVETNSNKTSNVGNYIQDAFRNWDIGNVRAVFSQDPFFNRNGINHFDRDVFQNDPFFQDAKKRFEDNHLKAF